MSQCVFSRIIAKSKDFNTPLDGSAFIKLYRREFIFQKILSPLYPSSINWKMKFPHTNLF